MKLNGFKLVLYIFQVIQGEVDESGFCSAAFAEENGKKNQNLHVIPCKCSLS